LVADGRQSNNFKVVCASVLLFPGRRPVQVVLTRSAYRTSHQRNTERVLLFYHSSTDFFDPSYFILPLYTLVCKRLPFQLPANLSFRSNPYLVLSCPLRRQLQLPHWLALAVRVHTPYSKTTRRRIAWSSKLEWSAIRK